MMSDEDQTSRATSPPGSAGPVLTSLTSLSPGFSRLKRISPVLVLQTFIIPIRKVRDGEVIEAVSVPLRVLAHHMERDPYYFQDASSRKFEELIAALYHMAGYEVILTPRSGDGGRDVIAVKRGFNGSRVLVQAKMYRPGHEVDADDVRAIIGVMHSDLGATNAAVATTSHFAPRLRDDPGIKLYLPHRLDLIDRPELIRRFRELDKT